MSACGWNLRGGENYSAPEALNLVSSDRYAPLTLAFLEAMQQRTITTSDAAPLQLILGPELLSKKTVAVTNIGSPSQYELTLSVDYRYLTEKEPPTITLAKSISIHRVFDFDPSNTVAKHQEEYTLLEEMRRELAHRILQQAPNLADDQ